MSLWFLLLLISLSVSEARHVKTLPSAIVVGTVYCDTCFQDDFSHHASHSISGATVAVECPDGSFRQQVKTDAQGKFRVHLPSSVSKHANKIKACSVKLVSSSEPYCAVASSATSSSIHLKSRKHGTHIFSAGFFTFKPLKQPSLCNQKSSSPLDFPPPLQDPIAPPDLPPLPPLEDKKAAQVPQSIFPPLLPPVIPNPLQPPPLIPNPLQPPPLIPNPLQPPPPLFPNPFQPPASPIPNPFQPPPAPLFPNPFQPPPAPPTIPLPFQPPPATPAPIFPFPPIPGFTPSPPPPPPTSLFPPFPFPPLPKIPGVPPASPSSKNPSP